MSGHGNWSNMGGPVSFGAAHGMDSAQEAKSGPLSNFSSGQGLPRGGLTRHAELLRGFFGEPTRQGRDALTDTYESYEKEKNDYPESFQQLYGSESGQMMPNGHISRVMMEKTMASMCWQLTRMAPLREHSTSLHFKWDVTIFAKHMLDKLSEEAVPRLQTHSRTGGYASMMRFGIAMLLEATFAETHAGQRMYRLNLEQMRIATVETWSYGVMIAAVEHKPYTADEAMARAGIRTGSQYTLHDCSRIFAEEKRWWGIVHKSRKGYAQLNAHMKKVLSMRPGMDGRTGDFEVIPQGMAAFLEDHHRKYYMDGPGTDASIEQSKQLEHTVVESRSFSLGHKQGQHDPMFRDATIGDYVTLDDTKLQSADVDKYMSTQMDLIGYTEDGDGGLTYLRYKSYYKFAGIWNFNVANAPLTMDIGRGFMHDVEAYTYGEALRKAGDSQFDRAVQRTLLLPVEKRQEFLQALRLLPPSDPRTKPGVRFDARAFDDMNDMRFNHPVTVTDVLAMRNGTATEDAYRRNRASRKRPVSDDPYADSDERKADDENVWAVPAQSIFQANVDNDEMEVDRPDAYRVSEDGTYAEHVPKHTVTKRAIRRGVRKADGKAPAKTLPEKIKSQKAKLLAEAAKITLRDGGKLIEDEAAFFLHFDGVFFSDEFKLEALSEFTRALQQEARRDPAGVPVVRRTADTCLHVIWTGFTRWAQSRELQLALANISVDVATSLETKCAQAGTVIGNTESVKHWWKPDGQEEDGQIGLACTGNLTVVSALPHDAFAATLSANHNVLFNLGTENFAKLNTKFKLDGAHLKRKRYDALAWSVALSLLFRNSLAAPSSDAMKAALGRLMEDDAVCPDYVRLKRFVDTGAATDRTSLLSQAPLASCINALSRLLIKAIQFGANHPSVVEPLVTAWNRVQELTGDAFDDLESYQLAALRSSTRLLEKAKGGHVTVEEEKRSEQVDSFIQKEKANAQRYGKVATAPDDVAWSVSRITDLYNRASLSFGVTYEAMVNLNIPVWGLLRLWRPNKTYRMGAVLRMKTGAMTTFFQKPHFMVAANAQLKTIFGNYSCYNKTVVFRNEWIFIMRNVFVNAYLGGGGTAVHDPNNRDHVNAFASNISEASIFVTMDLMKRADLTHKWLSITGRMPDDMPCTAEVNRHVWRPGADAWCKHWGYQTGDRSSWDPTKQKEANASEHERMFNVICFPSFERKYDPSTGTYSLNNPNEGHWGPSACYFGAARVTGGYEQCFQTPEYLGVKVMELV